MLLLGLALASEGERYLYVRWDAEKGAAVLSDGTPLPPGVRLVPGQYVEVEEGRLKPKRQWQPPQDLVRTFQPQGMGRVVFSHERHFGFLGAKGTSCETCHASLDKGKAWPSTAPNPSLEPHGPTSLGRFCATCHDGKRLVQQIPGSRSPIRGPVFTALGKKGAASCNLCHTPRDHGQDFTQGHGEVAERLGGQACASCHRGADQIGAAALALARAFQEAQLALIRNPDDSQAFNQILPANFCAYCHGLDGKAWRGK